ncbi:hypothetical protein [Arthrobacter sp. U41]|uniref:hypothetical protein n=1 Tax=Arthrobacter sp. U41 TaxID=1849032 RepID=UPI00085965E7|nr:hypothetical protein [Arthrobacter sp. U41]AOT02020.1 hypothetical protein ASPU41_00395 [Arthrobacter sp. U41]
MAPGFYGADVAQLRALSKSLGQSENRLKTVESSVNSLVQSAVWKGTDADKFRAEWTSSLRPMLNNASATLRHSSQLLLGQASEQDQASGSGSAVPASSGAGQAPATEAAVRSWGDAFTDPNYTHAPSGIEWLLELGGGDGSGSSTLANGLKFVADKFNWNIDLAQVEAGTSKFFDFMKGANRLLGVLGGAIGAFDVASGIAGKDPFRIADGVIGGGLSIAAVLATGTIVGAPAGVVLGAAALGWGVLGMMSGNAPVTKRIWDFGAGVVGGVKDLASGAKDALGWAGGKLGFG